MTLHEQLVEKVAEGFRHGRDVHGNEQIYPDCDTCVRIVGETIKLTGKTYDQWIEFSERNGDETFAKIGRILKAREEQEQNEPSEPSMDGDAW